MRTQNRTISIPVICRTSNPRKEHNGGCAFPVWQDGNTLRKYVRHRIRSWLRVNGHRESSSGWKYATREEIRVCCRNERELPGERNVARCFPPFQRQRLMNVLMAGNLATILPPPLSLKAPWPFFRSNVSATRRFHVTAGKKSSPLKRWLSKKKTAFARVPWWKIQNHDVRRHDVVGKSRRFTRLLTCRVDFIDEHWTEKARESEIAK